MHFVDCVCWIDVLLSIGIAIGVSAIAYIIVFSMRPRLKVGKVELRENHLRMPIVNDGRCDAHSLCVEVCIIETDTQSNKKLTYHFELDFHKFLILPTGDDAEKVFKTYSMSESAKIFGWEYDKAIAHLKKGSILRIRFHAIHSVSGLGRSFEEKYRLTDGVLERMK